jgi:hypothetical protein
MGLSAPANGQARDSALKPQMENAGRACLRPISDTLLAGLRLETFSHQRTIESWRGVYIRVQADCLADTAVIRLIRV